MNVARTIGDLQVLHRRFFAIHLAFGTLDRELLVLVVLDCGRTKLLICAEIHNEEEARRTNDELLKADRFGDQRALVVGNSAILACSCWPKKRSV